MIHNNKGGEGSPYCSSSSTTPKALADLRATLAVHMWMVCAVMVGSIKGVMIHNFTFYFLLSCAAFNIIQQLILIRNHILRTTM